MSVANAARALRTADGTRPPYPPGWPHLLLRALERLPGPTWVAYLGLVLLAALAMHSRGWSRGDAPVGTPDLASTYWGLLAGVIAWLYGYIGKAAGTAFERFRPALAPSTPDPERLRYELTTLPRVPALVAAFLATTLTVATFVADPASSDVDGVSGASFVVVLVTQAFAASFLFVFVWQLVRQTRQVRRILDHHAVVDIFRPGPLNSFSRFMATSGAAIVLVVASSMLVTDLSAASNFLLSNAPYLVLPPVIAVVAFVVPLYGTHQRLVEEKERLADEAEERLKGLLREVNRDIDARDLGGLDPLERALGSVIRQREIVAKLPTWPWSAGTARGFASAILLPLAIYVAQRLLSQLV